MATPYNAPVPKRNDESAPQIIDARFLMEVREPAAMPPAGPPEVAIGGRSNVGKSTLLNALAQRSSLARTSKTPGRTRGVMIYELVVATPEAADRLTLRLVDLPGYGYARVSQAERRSWGALVEGYVQGRPPLRMVLALTDARRDFGEEERELGVWLASLAVPQALVVTKTDKLGAAERGLIKQRVREQLPPLLAAAPIFPVSALTGDGVARLWRGVLRTVADTAPGASQIAP